VALLDDTVFARGGGVAAGQPLAQPVHDILASETPAVRIQFNLRFVLMANDTFGTELVLGAGEVVIGEGLIISDLPATVFAVSVCQVRTVGAFEHVLLERLFGRFVLPAVAAFVPAAAGALR